jgi:AbrB family looped-hinge helix DNA binding protein
MAIAAKITHKGQVTIPRKIREKLASEVVEFDVVGEQVILRPLISVAGSLKAYAGKETLPFQKGREKAWEKMTREKYGKKISRR